MKAGPISRGNRKHGHSLAPAGKRLTSKTYRAWQGMKDRCHNEKAKAFRNYGARGILVCERWRFSFENFLVDMGECPPGMSIERKDNERGYEPGNCRWATALEQSLNTRRNRKISANGLSLTMSQWARHLGCTPAAIKRRIDVLGWAPDRAVTTLPRPDHRRKNDSQTCD